MPDPDLFDVYSLGPQWLKNRIVMAPLTRCRAEQPGNLPTQLNACYYAQRAAAGLIVSEATQVSQQGQGYAGTPGIHSSEQAARWRLVTKAVHDADGVIFLQLWHVGRISHPTLQPDGQLPVAPSAIAPAGLVYIVNESGEREAVPFVPPRALAIEEMPYIVQQFARAAHNAKESGFDGIEIHAANGYLLDQFLNSTTNRRADRYGGSVANRARLLFDVLDAVCPILGSQRVGVRISPLGTFNDMGDENPEELFSYLAERLHQMNLAYLHVVNPAIAGNTTCDAPPPLADHLMKTIRTAYQGTLIVCGGYNLETAQAALRAGRADLIAFGRLFISNPDLPARLRENTALNTPDESSFYGGDAHGYVDYPSLRQERGEEPMVDFSALEQ